MVGDTWQLDWNSFATFLEQEIASAEGATNLSQLVGGKQIHWEGILAAEGIDMQSPNVSLKMPAREIHLGNGGSDVLSELFLPISDQSRDDWRKLALGDWVSFSARFVSANSVFGPVEIEDLGEGKRIVFIRLDDGAVDLPSSQ